MGDNRSTFPWLVALIWLGIIAIGAGIGAGVTVLGIRLYEMFTGT
jgi:hypothetical protein